MRPQMFRLPEWGPAVAVAGEGSESRDRAARTNTAPEETLVKHNRQAGKKARSPAGDMGLLAESVCAMIHGRCCRSVVNNNHASPHHNQGVDSLKTPEIGDGPDVRVHSHVTAKGPPPRLRLRSLTLPHPGPAAGSDSEPADGNGGVSPLASVWRQCGNLCTGFGSF